MELLKKIRRRLSRAKYLRSAVVLAALMLTVPFVAHASWLTDFSYTVIGKMMFGVSMFFGWIAGMLVAIEAFAVEWMLQLSVNIVSSPIVSVGFPVVLSLTNLVFVIGLIVIAISTILQIESYGLKNTLWKLLVMAVLVNFGLIIGGTILNFSDSITLYMVQAINPIECSPGQTDCNSLSQFASTIAGAFNPQNGYIYNVKDGGDISNMQQAFNDSAADIGGIIRPIVGAVMSLGGFTIIIVVMGALAVILLMRYVSVAFLLVSLPIAWASWPFPAFKRHFTDWWSKFLKQAFLPIPIVFFLWLGLVVAQEMGSQKLDIASIGYGSGILAGIVAFMGNLLMPVVQSVMQMLLLGGIMAMGLAAANKMGATFAGTAQNAIKAGQNRAKKEITSRIQRTAGRAGRAIQERTLPIQQQAIALRRATTAAVGERVAAASLAVQNLAMAKQGTQKVRVKMEMSGAIYKNGAQVGEAIWDEHKMDWKRDANGDLIDKNSGLGVDRSKLKVTGVNLKYNGLNAGTLTGDEAEKYGLVEGGKPVSNFAHLTLDKNAAERVYVGGKFTAAEMKDIRGVATLTSERLTETLHEYAPEKDAAGNIIGLSKRQKAVRNARLELAEAAAESPGVIRAVATFPLGEAFATMAKGPITGGSKGDSGHGGGEHKEEKKHDHKKGGRAHH